MGPAMAIQRYKVEDKSVIRDPSRGMGSIEREIVVFGFNYWVARLKRNWTYNRTTRGMEGVNFLEE